jgi:hypothetical protein
VMFKQIRAVLSGGPYYVRLRRTRLVVRNAATGALFDDEPIVAIEQGPKKKVLGLGAAARAASSNCINPFQHPRILVADFLGGCQKFCVRAGCIDQSLKTNRSPNWMASWAFAACHAIGGRFQFSVMCRSASQISFVAA